MSGGSGDDVIFGGAGSDRIEGGAGNDFIMSNHRAYANNDYGSPAQAGLITTPWIQGADWWSIVKDADGRLLSTNFVVNGYVRQIGGSFLLPPENPTDSDTVMGGAADDYIWGGLGDWSHAIRNNFDALVTQQYLCHLVLSAISATADNDVNFRSAA